MRCEAPSCPAGHESTRDRSACLPAPFLKWAGGKGKVAEAILAAAPRSFAAYHEPFLGGGAVFFALCRQGRMARAFLNDLEADLVAAWTAVRDAPEALVVALEGLAQGYIALPRDERAPFYYAVRASTPEDAAGRAARLLFLNRTCYNGLYRVNRRGQFNVPHGRYANPRILDRERLLAASACLSRAELTCADFATACRRAAPGDFVYLDPPYQPLSPTARFTGYTRTAFGEAEQVRLRDEFEALSRRGVAAVLSNSSHPFVEALYAGRGYTVRRVPVPRNINRDAAGRAPVDELLVCNVV